jgi:hypothetical protein
MPGTVYIRYKNYGISNIILNKCRKMVVVNVWFVALMAIIPCDHFSILAVI